jgi:hypothetical protein
LIFDFCFSLFTDHFVLVPSCSFSFPFRYPATDTDGDQHQHQQTMRVNHVVFDPIFIQYIITCSLSENGLLVLYWKPEKALADGSSRLSPYRLLHRYLERDVHFGSGPPN